MPKLIVISALLFALWLPQTAVAQDDPQQLREWFQSLEPEKRRQLRHRQRVLMRFSPERREQVLEAARAGQPVLTEEERTGLDRLRTMRGLERLKLQTLAQELQVLRRAQAHELREAMEQPEPERTRRVRQLLERHRAHIFMRTLKEEDRARLGELPPRERMRELIRLRAADAEVRREQLEAVFPLVAQLRSRAGQGDADAATELAQALADLRAVDMMLERLHPQAREAVLAEIRNLSIEDAAQHLRQELRRQWQRELRQRERPPGPPPEMGPRPEKHGNRQGQRRRDQ